MAKKRKLIHDGKAKKIYEGPEVGTCIQYFKDDVTAFNKEKHKIIDSKGIINNFISEFLMKKLAGGGIENHLIKRINSREQLIAQAEMIPLEVVVRRKAYGSFCSRYSVEEGLLFDDPLIEFFFKDDEKGDPLIPAETILELSIIDREEIDEIASYSIKICDILYGIFTAVGIDLIDFKLEFGRSYDIEFEGFFDIVLADEISPDSCRLHCLKTGESLDKDIFRNNNGDLLEAYLEVAKRLGILSDIQEAENNKIIPIR